MTGQHFDNLIDVTWASILAGVFLHWLPNATAVLAFALVCIRLYETKTVQALLKRLKAWLCG